MDKNSDESVKAQRHYMSSADESGGDEGDDEAEVGKGERGRDDAEEEEEEEEEEEPKLKYQRLWGSLPEILAKENAATCLGVAEKMLALGTQNGGVHILDFSGHEVKCFPSHTAAVNDVSFDLAGEYVASCSDDGTVVVNGLYSEERERHNYYRPIKTVAIDPEYSTKKDRQFVAGGLAGTLVLHTKGWLGPKDTALHSGEGPIHAVRWRTSLVAWANDLGVKLYDMATGQRISYIDMPRGGISAGLLRPHLVWQDDALLVIGWASTIKLAAIRTKSPNPPETPKPPSNGSVLAPAAAASTLMAGLNAMDFLGAAKTVGLGLPGPAKYVEILASIQADYLISGIAPYGKDLVVLAYIHDQPEGTATSAPPHASGQRPEVRILTRENEELTSDALSVNGFQQYQAKDYRLIHAPFMGSSEKGGQWSAGDEPLYYIVSPKDVVQAKPRDADDHVAWLVQHGRHEKALEAVEKGGARQEVLEEVGARYLDHLVLERQYGKAAQLCPKLLKGNAAAWERWVFHFASLRQLPALAPYIPTANPQLRETVYEVVLNAFLAAPSEHERFLDLVRTWPPSLYTVTTMIAAVQQRLVAFPHSAALQAALAELYLHNHQWEEALGLYLQLRRTDVFDFIERHKLQAACRDKALPLLKLDAPRAVTMLVQHRADIPPSDVVSQIQHEMRRQKRAGLAAPSGESSPGGSQAGPKGGRSRRDLRKLLHLYLHGLFEVDMTAGKEYHGMQVELYADYEPRFLLPFLRSSSFYPLEKAYETCKARGLTREVVFILGRMGNAREALGLIIEELHDMEQAIEFVSSQHDDELWEELISHSLHDPGMVGALLEHTVGNIDPLGLINRVPRGMAIPRLRDRLARIISDYRTETSLREGCNNILQSDCVALLIKFYNEARHAVRVGDPDPATPVAPEPPATTGASSLLNLPGFFPPPTVSSDELDRLPLLPSDEGSEVFGAFSFDAFMGTAKPAPVQTKDASKKKVGGNKPGRCSICLEPISVKDGDVVVFFCWHAYHLSCLSESEKRGKAASEEGLGKDGDEGLRCVLCTTAAAVKKNAHLLRTTTGSIDRSQTRSSVGWGQSASA